MVPSKFFFLIVALLALYCRAADDDGNNNDDNAGDDDSYQTPVEICEDMLVSVTAIQVLCDSPKTYYYGSGINRNSLVCDYGDKATITVDFDVMMDMGDDVDICGRHEKQSYRKKDITNAAEEVILTHNSMDNLVFSFGEKLFEAQLEVAKANVATEG